MKKLDLEWMIDGLRPEIGVLGRAEAHGSSGLAWKDYNWTKNLIYRGQLRFVDEESSRNYSFVEDFVLDK